MQIHPRYTYSTNYLCPRYFLHITNMPKRTSKNKKKSARKSSETEVIEDVVTPPKSGSKASLTEDSLPPRTDSGHKRASASTSRKENDKAISASPSDTSKEKVDDFPSEPQICKICGKVYDEPDIKHIPSGVAWLSFSCLFIFGLWWLSWIPFIVDQKHCNACKKPVKVCPYCYRRIDRPPV